MGISGFVWLSIWRQTSLKRGSHADTLALRECETDKTASYRSSPGLRGPIRRQSELLETITAGDLLRAYFINRFVTGHGFSRAKKGPKREGISPEGATQRLAKPIMNCALVNP